MSKNETHKEKMMRKKMERRNTMSKTETYYMKGGIPCIKDYGMGWKSGQLFQGLRYDITNLKHPVFDLRSEYPQGMVYSFELWDEEGLIGNYKVRKSDWEENSKKVI